MNTRSRVIEAELQLGGDTVTYRRAGEGPVVLFLHARSTGDGGAAEVWEAFRRLALQHRVVAPVDPPPGRREEAERWLRALVEGLGLRSPEVVAEAALAPLLSRFVRRNGGVVGRVIFLPVSEPTAAPEGGLPPGPSGR